MYLGRQNSIKTFNLYFFGLLSADLKNSSLEVDNNSRS